MACAACMCGCTEVDDIGIEMRTLCMRLAVCGCQCKRMPRDATSWGAGRMHASAVHGSNTASKYFMLVQLLTCSSPSAAAHLVEVGLQLQVLQALLQEGDERARGHVIATDVALVHEALVAEYKGRMREACAGKVQTAARERPLPTALTGLKQQCSYTGPICRQLEVTPGKGDTLQQKGCAGGTHLIPAGSGTLRS